MGIFKALGEMKRAAADAGGMPSMTDTFRTTERALDDRGERALVQKGISAMAIVRGFVSPVQGDRFAMQIPLEVHPPEGEPYTVNYVFPTFRMNSPITAGMEVPIKIDPDNPQHIAVQWDVQQATIAAHGGALAAVEDAMVKTYGGVANQSMEQALANRAAGARQASTEDPKSRIAKLEELRSSGLIDDAQFEAKKQQIIDEV